jgi:hypothetical protein
MVTKIRSPARRIYGLLAALALPMLAGCVAYDYPAYPAYPAAAPYVYVPGPYYGGYVGREHGWGWGRGWGHRGHGWEGRGWR